MDRWNPTPRGDKSIIVFHCSSFDFPRVQVLSLGKSCLAKSNVEQSKSPFLSDILGQLGGGGRFSSHSTLIPGKASTNGNDAGSFLWDEPSFIDPKNGSHCCKPFGANAE